MGPRRRHLVRRVGRPAPAPHRARRRAGRGDPGVARRWSRCAGPTATCTRSTVGSPLVRETHPVGPGVRSTWSTRSSSWTRRAEQDVVVSGPGLRLRPALVPRRRLAGMAGVGPPGDAVGRLDAQGPDAMGVVTVAGGVDEPGEGVCQPQWAPDGSLWFCTDRNDWWSLYRWTPEAGVEQMFSAPARSGTPKWQSSRHAVRLPRRRPRRARAPARGHGLDVPARARWNAGRPPVG